MATILKFRSSSDPTRTEAARPVCVPAELIIFPGVRYDRAELDAETPRTRSRARRRARDLIELPD